MKELERRLSMTTSTKRNGLSNGTSTRTPTKTVQSRITSTSNSSSPTSCMRAPNSRNQVNRHDDDRSTDSGIKINKDKFEQMANEVVNIKLMLFKLKKILEESESNNHDQNNLYEGLAASEASAAAGEGATSPQLADLQRQLVLLSAQLEERDSRIDRLEEALKRVNELRPVSQPPPSTRTNAATQTDRIRPLSTGPTFFQTSPDNTTTSFVSATKSVVPLSSTFVQQQRKKTYNNTK